MQNCNNPELLVRLKRFNTTLESILRLLENYLIVKRVAFPRFSFLSNDELLEMFSNIKQPIMLQPYLRKVFDAITKIELVEPSTFDVKVVSMTSSEPEKMPELVTFNDSILLSNMEKLEVWLSQILSKMVQDLKEKTQSAFFDYEQHALINDWMAKGHPAQCLIACNQIIFQNKVTEALLNQDASAQKLKEALVWKNDQITNLVDFVKRDNTIYL